jgi:hypothetical protein
VGINLDQEPSEAVMKEVRGLQFVKDAHYLKLPDLPPEESGD